MSMTIPENTQNQEFHPTGSVMASVAATQILTATLQAVVLDSTTTPSIEEIRKKNIEALLASQSNATPTSTSRFTYFKTILFGSIAIAVYSLSKYAFSEKTH